MRSFPCSSPKISWRSPSRHRDAASLILPDASALIRSPKVSRWLESPSSCLKYVSISPIPESPSPESAASTASNMPSGSSTTISAVVSMVSGTCPVSGGSSTSAPVSRAAAAASIAHVRLSGPLNTPNKKRPVTGKTSHLLPRLMPEAPAAYPEAPE